MTSKKLEMYIVINRDTMVLLHKHSDPEVLANIAWIECNTCPYYIFDLENAQGFQSFTDLELNLLFKNITNMHNEGVMDEIYRLKRKQIIQVIYDLCLRIPESNIDALEVEVQAESIQEGDDRKWLYVRGAKHPAQQQDLFKHTCKHSEFNNSELQNVKAGKLPALERKLQARTGATGHDQPVTNSSTAGNTVKGPKRGTNKAIIWSVADELWEKAGKPTNKMDILAVRKEVMNKLEKEEGIKRTSASSELANWHKTKEV